MQEKVPLSSLEISGDWALAGQNQEVTLEVKGFTMKFWF